MILYCIGNLQRLCTALHHAAMKGFTECAKLLLEAGAVVNVQDKVILIIRTGESFPALDRK